MDPGFEAAKGAAEKLLVVKFPVLMQIVFPGLLATGAIYPSVVWALRKLPREPDYLWRGGAYVILVILLGALVSLAGDEIYKVYEGRVRWPQRLFDWARKLEQARIKRLRERADAASAAGNHVKSGECWFELRAYPIDADGDPEARFPTRVGNILAGYEDYPNNRYGMDSIFYWPRLWLQLDKDKKEEIEGQWCVADGFLTLSAISFGAAILWTAQALIAVLGTFSQSLPFGDSGWALLGAAGWLVAGFFWYRASLPFHRKNGEIFKSIFDLYRDKVWSMTSLKPDEKQAWKSAWGYLQYLILRCPNCGSFNDYGRAKCWKCGFGQLETYRNLRQTGRFPVDTERFPPET